MVLSTVLLLGVEELADWPAALIVSLLEGLGIAQRADVFRASCGGRSMANRDEIDEHHCGKVGKISRGKGEEEEEASEI